jgi:hypothetical protein
MLDKSKMITRTNTASELLHVMYDDDETISRFGSYCYGHWNWSNNITPIYTSWYHWEMCKGRGSFSIKQLFSCFKKW